MGQNEIYDFLKKNKKNWFSSKEISEKININISSVNYSLSKLFKRGDVYFKENKYLNYKRRTYKVWKIRRC